MSDYDDVDSVASTEMSNIHEVPEGIIKEILTEGSSDSSTILHPERGDTVYVHYVGTLLDGTKFDSSRDRGEEFSFKIGAGQVISGWDRGVPTMKRGEIANFTLPPEFAYGERGAPPTIPPNSTLKFEIELIDWKSERDIDGGRRIILHKKVKREDHWKAPETGNECILSIAKINDNEDRQEFPQFVHSVGIDVNTECPKITVSALDLILRNSMKPGAISQFEIQSPFTPDNGLYEINFIKMIETENVSIIKDKNIVEKKLIARGDGHQFAKFGDKIVIKFIEISSDLNKEYLNSFNDDISQSISLSAGQVHEYGVLIEHAIWKCLPKEDCILKSDNTDIKPIRIYIESIEKTEESVDSEEYSMSLDQKIKYGTKLKENGTAWLKKSELIMALDRYTRGIQLFKILNEDEKKNESVKSLKKALYSNLVLSELNINGRLPNFINPQEIVEHCDCALELDMENVKMLYRKGKALELTKDYESGIRLLKQVDDSDCQKLCRILLAKQKKIDDQEKGMFAKMFK